MTQASVIRLEKAVFDNDFEAGCTELLKILGELDSAFGAFANIECDYPNQLLFSEEEKAKHVCQRIANAVSTLFHAKNDFGISDTGFMRFMTLHRWLGIIFATSNFVNADHIIATYHQGKPEEYLTALELSNNLNIWRKFCILYTQESNISLTLDVLWNVDRYLCGALCFALQSSRFIGTSSAFDKRSAILKWFPSHLAQFENLDNLPSAIGHDVYMHCSYDIAQDKHRVKESLNQVIRRHLLALGREDRDVSKIGQKDGKPIMFVALEHFHLAHSIYRTHSTSLRASREHFYVVGFGNTNVDEVAREVFDEFIEVEKGNVIDKIDLIRQKADELEPAVLYMPSIGMDLTTVFLSNLRIAPVQAVALGHPATTHSPFIDYVVVEDDYVGSESCFSEKLIRLPKDALPYVPSALAPTSVDYVMRENPEVVQIGVASTTMKLNPYFLKACQVIRDRSAVKVHFHFALGQSSGITHPYVKRFIQSYLGEDATVHAHKPYQEYLSVLHRCDMLINPFPFGNTNGIIDMVTLGLVGICKTGDEVHEHIDEGLFDRLGLPKEDLVAHSADDYVQKAIELAQNHEKRLALRRHVIDNNGLNKLFAGNPAPMGERFLQKVRDTGVLDEKKPAKRSTKASADKAKTTTKKTPAKRTTKKK